MSTIPLTEIPTLELLYKLQKLHPLEGPLDANATSKYNDKISLIRTDITKLETDAIVNAANESLLGGGGVDGAIHRAAGRELLDECETLDGCDTGSAKITDGYRLPCKKVIHAVGPIYHSTKRKGMHTTLLQSCYTTSLDLAVQNDCTSIAFSALSTGIYGYPSDEAAETAIQAVKGWLEHDEERANKMERIVFCQFMEKDEIAYEEHIPKYFPPTISAAEDSGKGKDTRPVAESSDGGAEKISDLPDAPTKEPQDPDQPEAKKLKLSQDEETKLEEAS